MRRGILLIATLGLTVILWWILHDRPSTSETRSQPVRTALTSSPVARLESGDPNEQSDALQSEPESSPEPLAAADAIDPASQRHAATGLDQTIELYRETMVYPLSSRPADGSNDHLTRWNRPISVGQPFAVDAARREIQASATIDRIFAAPGQAISLRATVSYVADGTPAQVEQIGAELQWRDRQADAWVTLQPVPLAEAAEGWLGSVVPSRVEALRAQPRETRLLVHARIGDFARDLALEFSYAAEQPVVVHDIVSDRVVDGSLELGLDVELRAAAPVALVATLFAADGTTAIGVFDDRYFPGRPGRQVIPVRFFGRVLHRRKIDGPYRLGAVHGYVYRRGVVPDQLYFDRADAPAMVTAAHPAAAFSPDAYQSPEVAARIAHYEALREALRAGRPPPPPPAQAAP